MACRPRRAGRRRRGLAVVVDAAGPLRGRRSEPRTRQVIPFHMPRPQGRALEVLVVGAHADDLEIGCGGPSSTWPLVTCRCTSPGWPGSRGRPGTGGGQQRRSVPEGRRADHPGAQGVPGRVLPLGGAEVKEVFEDLKGSVSPTSSSSPAVTTPTGIIAWSLSSPGTRSATTWCSSTRSPSMTATWGTPTCSCRYRRQSASGRWNCCWSSSPVSTTAVGSPQIPCGHCCAYAA
jgi:hypothetical protein